MRVVPGRDTAAAVLLYAVAVARGVAAQCVAVGNDVHTSNIVDPFRIGVGARAQNGGGYYTRPYGNGDCYGWWLHCSSSSQVVVFEPIAFDTENSDTLKLHDGTSTSGSQLLSRSGGSMPAYAAYASTGRDMYVHWSTDGSGTDEGWMANVKCVTPGGSFIGCSPGEYLLGGAINRCYNCPGGQYDYESNHWSSSSACSDCSAGKFSDDTYGGHTSCSDCPAGFTSPNNAGGCNKCSTTHTHSFLGSADAIMSKRIGVGARAQASGVSDSNRAYGNDDCYGWSLRCYDSSQVVMFEPIAFDTEFADYLKVYDGTSTDGTELLSHSGGSMPTSDYLSSGRDMYVHWVTDGSDIGYAGWMADVICVTPGGSDSSCSAGSYLLGGAIGRCNNCPSGQYESNNLCYNCITGKYATSRFIGVTSCIDCPAGKTSPRNGIDFSECTAPPAPPSANTGDSGGGGGVIIGIVVAVLLVCGAIGAIGYKLHSNSQKGGSVAAVVTVQASPDPAPAPAPETQPVPSTKPVAEDLSSLTVKELRDKAAAVGIDPVAIEHARDGDDPKAELLQLVQSAMP
jgi:hypothetical protein